MCGIFCVFGHLDQCLIVEKDRDKDKNNDLLLNPHGKHKNAFYPNQIQHRGPDKTSRHECSKNGLVIFHRLAIMDPSEHGNQPFVSRDGRNILVCNGEIYNHRELAKHYELECKSKSDCEVLLRMSEINKLQPNKLDGEFVYVNVRKGFYNFDINSSVKRSQEELEDPEYLYVTVARDPLGIRPLFIYLDITTTNVSSATHVLALSSEIKAFQRVRYPRQIMAFPAGALLSFKVVSGKIRSYNLMAYESIPKYVSVLKNKDYHFVVRDLFFNAVQKRIHADQPVGCLLSGGLDSSLVTACAAKFLHEYNPHAKLQTFTIGMEDSTDMKFANDVADFLNKKYGNIQHTNIVPSVANFLDAIPTVIKSIESYDITTVRASVGMWLMARYIRLNTNCRVILSGEISDELCQGYMYFHHQPSSVDGDLESRRLLNDILCFDVLRADRCISAHGLELRLPFSDSNFVKAYLSLPSELRCPQFGMEKWFLRQSFAKLDLLPEHVLNRPKEAMSDSFSGNKNRDNSWFQIIQRHVDLLITDEEFKEQAVKFQHNTPKTKEALWYRREFETRYFGMSHLIPYMWMPKFIENTNDPSARTLTIYDDKMK